MLFRIPFGLMNTMIDPAIAHAIRPMSIALPCRLLRDKAEL